MVFVLPVLVGAYSTPTEPYSRPLEAFDNERVAYVAWRLFWESAPSLSGLTSDDLTKEAEGVRSLFHQYFEDVVVSDAFKFREREFINAVVLREVLRASFVYSLLISSKKTQGLELAAHGLTETPLPIVFVSPIGQSISVRWVHQRELSKIGNKMFGPTSANR